MINIIIITTHIIINITVPTTLSRRPGTVQMPWREGRRSCPGLALADLLIHSGLHRARCLNVRSNASLGPLTLTLVFAAFVMRAA